MLFRKYFIQFDKKQQKLFIFLYACNTHLLPTVLSTPAMDLDLYLRNMSRDGNFIRLLIQLFVFTLERQIMRCHCNSKSLNRFSSNSQTVFYFPYMHTDKYVFRELKHILLTIHVFINHLTFVQFFILLINLFPRIIIL